jgi:uncharacterized SAM-binding protein YcdF (DUF218 family)
MKAGNIIIVLGSTNDDNGNISRIGHQRLDKAIDLLNSIPNSRLILTGGYGSHFNSTDKPYAYYAQQYFDKNRIIGSVLSKDTIEDAQLSLPLIKSENPMATIHIVTSDFHLERVKYIFTRVLKLYDLKFHESIYITNKEEQEALNLAEKRELKLLRVTGKSSLGSVL